MTAGDTALPRFPTTRLRRLRSTEAVRSMVRETSLSVQDFIYPLFVVPGSRVKKEVSSMPGVYQMSADVVVKECAEVAGLGIPAVIFFGIPEAKDDVGSVINPKARSESSPEIITFSVKDATSIFPGSFTTRRAGHW